MELFKSRLSSLRKATGRGLAVLGAGAAISSMALAAARYQALRAERALPPEFILELDLELFTLVEKTSLMSPLALVKGDAQSQLELRRVVRALRDAGEDPRVRGVLARVGSREGLGGMAMAQELRDAVSNYRLLAAARGGKAPAVAFAPAFGEGGGNGTLQYYVASAFDQVYMQPSGQVGLMGIMSQQIFLRGLLDRFKIRPIFYTREAYKTAAHPFTQYDWTPEHKEMTASLLKSLTSQMWEGMCVSRGLRPEALRSAVDAAPLLASEALAWGKQLGGTGLLDGLKYRHEVLDGLTKTPQLLNTEREQLLKAGKVGPAAEPDYRLPRLPIQKYLLIKELGDMSKTSEGWLDSSSWRGLWPGNWMRESMPKGAYPGDGGSPTRGGPARTSEDAGWVSRAVGRGRPKVAVIHCLGTIVQGPVKGPQRGAQVIDAAKLSAQLDRLAKAQDVAAVVLRISSPGGSALGSDTLHRALTNLRASGKKLVISCGDVAASGGMFMAVAGDTIFVQPGSITGSIGVVTGKFYAKDLVEEYGIKPASLEDGSPNLTLASPFHAPDTQQEEHIQRFMDSIYDDFLGKVAVGRSMSVEAVRALAGGRVYTGAQALKVGLADKLGGLQDAIDEAKTLAKLPMGKDDVHVFDYPSRKIPLLVRLLNSMGPGAPGSDPETATTLETQTGLAAHVLALAAAGLEGSWTSDGTLAAGIASEGSSSAAGGLAGGIAHLAAMAGVSQATPGGGGMQTALQAAGSALATAALLDGTPACYSAEAHVLARTLG